MKPRSHTPTDTADIIGALLAPAEIAAHLSDDVVMRVLEDAVQKLANGDQPTLRFRAGFTLADVLRRLRADRREEVRLSLLLGLSHVATIAEIAEMVAGRANISIERIPS